MHLQVICLAKWLSSSFQAVNLKKKKNKNIEFERLGC